MPNDAPVTTRPLDWAALVRKQWGEEYNVPEDVYEFSNGRKFKNSDQADGGPYGVTIP